MFNILQVSDIYNHHSLEVLLSGFLIDSPNTIKPDILLFCQTSHLCRHAPCLQATLVISTWQAAVFILFIMQISENIAIHNYYYYPRGDFSPSGL